MTKLPGVTLTFTTLISLYKNLQSGLVRQIRRLVRNSTSVTPGSFLLVQFQMSQVTQIGESISNLISQVNSVVNHAVQNQRVQ
jgi:hypothetical protein